MSIVRSLARQCTRAVSPFLLATESAEAMQRVGTTTRVISTSRPAAGDKTDKTDKTDETGAPTISVTYHDEKDESVKTVRVPVGENLMEAAHENDIDLEGACEGSLACSTCHIVIESREVFDKLPEADDDENDMLDLAFGLTETSRLGCQVIASADLDGVTVRIPSATRNFAVDGHVPKPH